MVHYGWRRVAVISEPTVGSCFYGASALEQRLKSDNAIGAGIHLQLITWQSEPSSEDINDILDLIRNNFRGTLQNLYNIAEGKFTVQISDGSVYRSQILPVYRLSPTCNFLINLIATSQTKQNQVVQ